MVAGRNPIYNKPEIAKELIEWSKNEDSFNLCEFCAIKMIPPSYLIRWSNEDEKFCEALQIAKAFLGGRREKGLALGAIHQKAYDLNAKVYDAFLKHDSRDEKEFEAALKLKEQEQVNEEITSKYLAVLSQLQALREASEKPASDTKASDSHSD